jgi:hypothetical protein
MKFWISIMVNSWKKNKYLVEHTLVNLREERFRVIGRNGHITFSCNRPLYRHKGVRHRRPDLKLIEGYLSNKSIEKDIVEQIKQYIEKHMD